MATIKGTLAFAEYDTVAKTLALTFQASDLPAPLPANVQARQDVGNANPSPQTLKVTVNTAGSTSNQASCIYENADGTWWRIDWTGAAWSAPVQVNPDGTAKA